MPPPPSHKTADLARELLLYKMREYSEELHCAGWLCDLEFLLWEIPEQQDHPAVQARRQCASECRELAELAGGWWVYEDETRPGERGPVFIPMERWLQILQRRQQQDSP